LTTAPLAIRASPGALAAAEKRVLPTPKELGPWDRGFDQGAWRDAHPTKQEQEVTVRAYREKQEQPLEKEPSVSLEKFKQVLQTPAGLAGAVTVAA
jgi:hypothetical protein